MEDIDKYSDWLEIPWEKGKDIPFRVEVLFVGFMWNLEKCTMAVPVVKWDRYLWAIDGWLQLPSHDLKETQELYRKLFHIYYIISDDCTYLTNLEAFMGLFIKDPFLPHTPP